MKRIVTRYSFCEAARDENDRIFLTDREPYRYYPHVDNRVHNVVDGDTLFNLAGTYFNPFERACGYWWVIADFQPDTPIQDPTLILETSSKIHIPSLRILETVILSEFRRGQNV